MARVIERIGTIRHKPRRLPPFQSLVHAVIHQHLALGDNLRKNVIAVEKLLC